MEFVVQFAAAAVLCASLLVACILEAEATEPDGSWLLVGMTVVFIASVGLVVYEAVYG